MHRGALDADPPPMNQPHFAKTPLVGRPQVLIHDRPHVARRERVQIERILDRDVDRLVVERYSRGPPITCSFQ